VINPGHPAARRQAAVPPALRRLASLRYEIRRFLRFSEKAARGAGLTPMQHQMLLGVAGFTGRGWATISELAEFLQARHNSVVELVKRGVRVGLVAKDPQPGDRRFVRVRLTPSGERLLSRLSNVHLGEIRRLRTHLQRVGFTRPRHAKQGRR